MVKKRLTDGTRIGQLLASEVTGNHGRLRYLTVSDADPDVDPTADGALGYSLVYEGDATDTDRLAEVYVQPDRIRIEFLVVPETAADAGAEAGLRVRPKAVHPPRTLVFVEDGAAVKRVLPVLKRVLARVDDERADE